MSNNKNVNNLLSQNNSLNGFNSANKALINSELSIIRQDLLYFKNDILRDVRKMEEKFNLRFTEQSIINSEHYNVYDKKIDTLSTQMNIANSMILNNSNLNEKVNNFQTFKAKAEDYLLSLNSRLNSFQKEYRDSFNTIEKLINDNLRYPGVIGNNGKYQNFRRFIDYILNYFKEFNEFKEEIKDLNFNSLKREINTSLQEFRYSISTSYRSSLNLIENNAKEFDTKLKDFIKNNRKIIDENEEKFMELKNKIEKYFSEYQAKFSLLEKNINDKQMQQIKEMDNFKKLREQIMNDINNIKENIDSNKTINESKNENNEKKYIVKIINNNYMSENQQVLKENNLINNDDKTSEKKIFEQKKEINNINNNEKDSNKEFLTSKGRNNFILNEILSNNNINDKLDSSMDKNNNIFGRNHDNKINNMMNRTQMIGQSNSLENIHDTLDLKKFSINYNSKNLKEQLTLTPDEIMNKKERIDILNLESKKLDIFNKYKNSPKKDNNKNNYSISNIANVKIKKVILPEFLTKRNTKLRMSKSSISENARIKITPNNKTSSAKYIEKEKVKNIKKNNLFDITKINKPKNEKIKGIKLSGSSKKLNKNNKGKINDNLKSLMVMKISPRNKDLNEFGLLKKGKKRNLSFEGKKRKDEQIQIKFGNTFYDKNKLKELILMNPKSINKKRKIKL